MWGGGILVGAASRGRLEEQVEWQCWWQQMCPLVFHGKCSGPGDGAVLPVCPLAASPTVTGFSHFSWNSRTWLIISAMDLSDLCSKSAWALLCDSGCPALSWCLSAQLHGNGLVGARCSPGRWVWPACSQLLDVRCGHCHHAMSPQVWPGEMHEHQPRVGGRCQCDHVHKDAEVDRPAVTSPRLGQCGISCLATALLTHSYSYRAHFSVFAWYVKGIQVLPGDLFTCHKTWHIPPSLQSCQILSYLGGLLFWHRVRLTGSVGLLFSAGLSVLSVQIRLYWPAQITMSSQIELDPQLL